DGDTVDPRFEDGVELVDDRHVGREVTSGGAAGLGDVAHQGEGSELVVVADQVLPPVAAADDGDLRRPGHRVATFRPAEPAVRGAPAARNSWCFVIGLPRWPPRTCSAAFPWGRDVPFASTAVAAAVCRRTCPIASSPLDATPSSAVRSASRDQTAELLYDTLP